VDNIAILLRPWLQKVVSLTLEKEVLPIAPLSKTGIDFCFFDSKNMGF
jgi:hypothetical protein